MESLHMVDMRKTPAEKAEDCLPCPANAPDYPYGLCISLTECELEKLGLTHESFDDGELVHLHAIGVVTTVSSTKNLGGDPHCRVEIQLTHISQPENEDAENAENEAEEDTPTYSRLYS